MNTTFFDLLMCSQTHFALGIQKLLLIFIIVNTSISILLWIAHRAENIQTCLIVSLWKSRMHNLLK